METNDVIGHTKAELPSYTDSTYKALAIILPRIDKTSKALHTDCT